MPKTLPAQPHIDWLKKTAKERLQELRASDPSAKLALAQREVANDYGYKSWRALKGHVDTVSLAGKMVAAAATGDADELARLLSEHPRKIDVTGGAWDRPLLHHAAGGGHIACVELLLARGFDVDRRDRFDHATALHWAAGEGPPVRRQASARCWGRHRRRRRRPRAGRARLGHMPRQDARGRGRIPALARCPPWHLPRHCARPRRRRARDGHCRPEPARAPHEPQRAGAAGAASRRAVLATGHRSPAAGAGRRRRRP